MTAEISIAEYRALLKRQQRKYGAEPIVVDGYRFDSQAEADRYQELRLQEQAGDIRDLKVHPSYLLQEAFRDGQGRRVGAIRYEADFSYVEVAGGAQVVEEVKGVRTQAYQIKAKLFRYRYPQIDYRVIEVGRC